MALSVVDLGCPCDLPPPGQRLGGMGLLDEVLGIVSATAEPGALAYATYVQDKQAREDYRARRAEAAAQLEARRVEAEAAQARAVAEAPLRQARVEQVGEVAKVVAGGLAVAAAGLVAYKVGGLALRALGVLK